MRVTEDLPDVEVTSIEWPDDHTPCGWPDCELSAAWWTECSCGWLAAACDPHRIAADQRRNPNTGTALCVQCGKRMPTPFVWKPLR